jgi:hypothetical protein
MKTVEILRARAMSAKAEAMIAAIANAARTNGDLVRETNSYHGESEILVLYGVGAPVNDEARKRQVKSGRRVLMWDLAYFERTKYLRCSINHDHPQAFLDATPNDPTRWQELKIPLRDTYDPDGHIVLVGLGAKSRAYLHEQEWEALRLSELRKRFPGRRIVYKPKPGSPVLKLDCEFVAQMAPIEDVLNHAFLVSCRHSNVACDAAIAGVPFECTDGAAMWLRDKPYTRENRLDFLRRLAHWQYRPDEDAQAWAFAQEITAERIAA